MTSNYTNVTFLSPTLDVEEYLKRLFGPAKMESAELFTSIYAVLLITGVTGNVGTIYTIVTNKRLHTPTNYYLVSLAMSDLFILTLGITAETYSFWHQASETFLCVSILTIMAFTIERYLAIVYPFLSRKLMTSRRSRIYKIIAFVWIIGVLNSIPYAVYSEINFVQHPYNGTYIEESAWCGCPWDNKIIKSWLEYSFAVFFVLPVIILAILYAHIGLTLSKQNVVKRHGVPTSKRNSLKNSAVDSESPQQSLRRIKSRMAIIRMLVGIVFSFFVCFSVFHAQRLMSMYVQWQTASDSLKALYTKLTLISGSLFYLNPTLNPIMYALHTRTFRSALFACFKHCGWSSKTQRTLSLISSTRVVTERPKSIVSRLESKPKCTPAEEFV